MESVPAVNATQLLQLSESVQVSLMRSVEFAAEEASARIGFVVPIDAVIEAAALALLTVIVLLCCAFRAVRRARREARDRKNIMIVAAANGPEDDNEEHEQEQHSFGRGAAPGDSDLDDECISRSHAPASGARSL